MKSRQTLAPHPKLSSKSVNVDKARSASDVDASKKGNPKLSLQKSAQILKNYHTVFQKPNGNIIGDADTYFKQSLRHYDYFDLTKLVNLDLKQLKNKKPLTLVTTEAKRKSLSVGDGDKKNFDTLSKPTFDTSSGEQSKTEFLANLDEQEDLFYSPSSQIFDEEEPTKDSDKQADTMADEENPDITGILDEAVDVPEETTDVPEETTDVPEETADVPETTDVEAVEELVEQADDEINQVEQENQEMQQTMEDLDNANIDGEEEDWEGEATGDTGEVIDASDVEDITEHTDESGIPEESEPEGDEVVIDSVVPAEAPAETTTTAADKPKSPPEGGRRRTSTLSYDVNMDSAILGELEDAESQAMQAAKIIYELKERVGQLLSKQKMTVAEGRELDVKRTQLKEKMLLFEEKINRIQFLVKQANQFDKVIAAHRQVSKEYKEDVLPKVLICGTTENNMPKIVVCNDKKEQPARRYSSRPCGPPPQTQPSPCHTCAPPPKQYPPTPKLCPALQQQTMGGVPQFAKRLCESYNMQEKLALENADLEGKRYQLQEDLLNKDQTVESLQRKLNTLQAELRLIHKENSILNEKLKTTEGISPAYSRGDNNQAVPCSKPKPKMPCGKNKGICPASVEGRLQEYSETTQQLETQLSEMESEVRNMQTELVAVQKERQHLEHHRKMMCPPPPCGSPPPCAPQPCSPPSPPKSTCPAPCNTARSGSSDQQLRELREQYNRLQDDYKGKLTEVAGLRADTEKLKQTAKSAEEAKKIAEDKVKEYEKELKTNRLDKNKLLGSKEQLIEQEQQLNVAKQRFREAQDELEELRALIQDQQSQLDDYRNKYLQAQQQVEEQRRQIDMMEMENNRIGEQVNLEIQRVKNQFQEKLQELTPLPDILKATQLKLQEAQQMHLMAERNNEALARELQAYKDQATAMADQIEQVRSDQQLGADERMTVEQRAKEFERRCNEQQEENDRLKTEFARMEEIAEQNEKRVQEKLHEIAQLVSQLETVREESARQVARTKDRCETVRRSMQNQIADLERQLAQSRAQARQAQKDRDDIRQKMQSQINNLNENFDDAQMRIRNLQGHVNFLKSSYTTVFQPNDPPPGVPEGMDACDCGNNY